MKNPPLPNRHTVYVRLSKLDYAHSPLQIPRSKVLVALCGLLWLLAEIVIGWAVIGVVTISSYIALHRLHVFSLRDAYLCALGSEVALVVGNRIVTGIRGKQ